MTPEQPRTSKVAGQGSSSAATHRKSKGRSGSGSESEERRRHRTSEDAAATQRRGKQKQKQKPSTKSAGRDDRGLSANNGLSTVAGELVTPSFVGAGASSQVAVVSTVGMRKSASRPRARSEGLAGEKGVPVGGSLSETRASGPLGVATPATSAKEHRQQHRKNQFRGSGEEELAVLTSDEDSSAATGGASEGAEGEEFGDLGGEGYEEGTLGLSAIDRIARHLAVAAAGGSAEGENRKREGGGSHHVGGGLTGGDGLDEAERTPVSVKNILRERGGGGGFYRFFSRHTFPCDSC